MTCYDCSAPPVVDRTRCEKHLAARRASAVKFLEMNRERISAERAARYAAKPIAVRRNADMIAKYGISISEYMALHDEQDGRCAICLHPETSLGNHGKVKNLSIDHDHATGRIRGLLCNNCNRALGLLKDSEITLLAALAYLRASAGVLS